MPNKINNKKKKAVTEMSLRDLFVRKLKALFYIENQLVKALPKMAKNASEPELRNGFEEHLEQTKKHVERLSRAFDMLNEKPAKLACDGIDGIIADAEWVIKNTKGDAALDANLAAAAQYAEHYEIAGYEAAIGWAKQLDENDIADLLEQTLDEEEETSETLKDLADTKLDEAAAGKDDSDSENDGWKGRKNENNKDTGGAKEKEEDLEDDDAEEEDEEEDDEDENDEESQ